MPEHVLGQAQHRQERAALVRVEPLEPPDFLELVGAEFGVLGVRHSGPGWQAGWEVGRHLGWQAGWELGRPALFFLNGHGEPCPL